MSFFRRLTLFFGLGRLDGSNAESDVRNGMV